MEELDTDIDIVLVGVMNKGKFVKNQKICLGPDKEGKFRVVSIMNLECNKVEVLTVKAG